MQLKIPV